MDHPTDGTFWIPGIMVIPLILASGSAGRETSLVKATGLHDPQATLCFWHNHLRSMYIFNSRQTISRGFYVIVTRVYDTDLNW